MGYKEHAMLEFRAAGWCDADGKFEDEMQEHMCNDLLELLDVFASQGHSGFSSGYALSLFTKLAKFDPIMPLTGEDWEWNKVNPGVYQNIRCSHVFKQWDRFNGQAYDIDGKIFWEWCERELNEDEPGYPGTTKYQSFFTNSDSYVPITFPYTPMKEYVEIQPMEQLQLDLKNA